VLQTGITQHGNELSVFWVTVTPYLAFSELSLVHCAAPMLNTAKVHLIYVKSHGEIDKLWHFAEICLLYYEVERKT
jgi:hypothetical protein